MFSMEDWDELMYLVDDSDSETTTFADVVHLDYRARHDGREPKNTDALVEDEEEDAEMAMYCSCVELDHLLELVLQAIPEGFTAAVVPPPEWVLSGTQIAITRGH